MMDWKPLLYSYSMHMAGSQWDAEDLTQDAWLKLSEALCKEPERPVSNEVVHVYRTPAEVEKVKAHLFHFAG